MSEGVGARRRTSARRSFSENTLPAEYLERLEQKRKQLDESIHKYIAAKEREYKLFERELKQEHKLSQGQDGFHNLQRAQSEPGGNSDHNAALPASERIAATDALSIFPSRQSLSHTSATAQARASSSPKHRPQDSKSASEREKYLEGLFTPTFLSALDDKGKNRLERTLSDPPIPTSDIDAPQQSTLMERANSDSYDQAKLKRPPQLVLAQRTSSSGSSADGKLASAMRSPTHRPKHKRVSLAVGDSIVAPSDNVPPALTQNSTPSHSRRRSQVPERQHPFSTKRSAADSDEQPSAPRASSPLADEVVFDAATMDGDDLPALPPAAVDPASDNVQASKTRSSTIDPDGDLFDLVDVELHGSSGQDDDDYDDPENVFANDDVIVGRVRSADQTFIPPLPADGRTRYDPATGLIPEPEDEKEDSAVPNLAFGPSSSVGPHEPGFRRPSVVDDPIYLGDDYQTAERRAVENDVYGSSANRPRGSFTPGSLGQSYMAKHAEEMMRARLAKRSTSVES